MRVDFALCILAVCLLLLLPILSEYDGHEAKIAVIQQDPRRVDDGSRDIPAPVRNGHTKNADTKRMEEYLDKVALQSQQTTTKAHNHTHPSTRVTRSDAIVEKTDLQKKFSTSRSDDAGPVISPDNRRHPEGGVKGKGKGKGIRKRPDKETRRKQKMEQDAKDDVSKNPSRDHPTTPHANMEYEPVTSPPGHHRAESRSRPPDSVLGPTKDRASIKHDETLKHKDRRENSQQAPIQPLIDRMVFPSPITERKLEIRPQAHEEIGLSEEDGHQWTKKSKGKDEKRGGTRGRGSKRGGRGRG